MSDSRKKAALRFLFGGAVVLTVLTGGVFAFVDTRPIEARAAEWALETAAAGRLPTALEDYVALPFEYRTAAYRLMSPAQKSGLWRSHILAFAASNTLSAEQQAFIKRATDLASPELYDDSNPARKLELRAQVQAFCKQAQTLFTKEQKRILGEIASQGAPATRPSEGRFMAIARYVASFTTANAGVEADCRCSSGSWCDECEGGEVCKDLPCTTVIDACGCLGASNCHHKCEAPIMN